MCVLFNVAWSDKAMDKPEDVHAIQAHSALTVVDAAHSFTFTFAFVFDSYFLLLNNSAFFSLCSSLLFSFCIDVAVFSLFSISLTVFLTPCPFARPYSQICAFSPLFVLSLSPTHFHYVPHSNARPSVSLCDRLPTFFLHTRRTLATCIFRT